MQTEQEPEPDGPCESDSLPDSILVGPVGHRDYWNNRRSVLYSRNTLDTRQEEPVDVVRVGLEELPLHLGHGEDVILAWDNVNLFYLWDSPQILCYRLFFAELGR